MWAHGAASGQSAQLDYLVVGFGLLVLARALQCHGRSELKRGAECEGSRRGAGRRSNGASVTRALLELQGSRELGLGSGHGAKGGGSEGRRRRDVSLGSLLSCSLSAKSNGGPDRVLLLTSEEQAAGDAGLELELLVHAEAARRRGSDGRDELRRVVGHRSQRALESARTHRGMRGRVGGLAVRCARNGHGAGHAGWWSSRLVV